MGPVKEGPEFNKAVRSIMKSSQPICELSVLRVGGIGETLPDA